VFSLTLPLFSSVISLLIEDLVIDLSEFSTDLIQVLSSKLTIKRVFFGLKIKINVKRSIIG
jgi:hypothetical protein